MSISLYSNDTPVKLKWHDSMTHCLFFPEYNLNHSVFISLLMMSFFLLPVGPPTKVAKRSEGDGSGNGRSFAAALRSLAKQKGPESGKEVAGGGGSGDKEKAVTVAPSPPPPAPKQPSPHPTLPSSGFQPYRPDDR